MSVAMKPETQRGPEADIEALERQFEEEKAKQKLKKNVPFKPSGVNPDGSTMSQDDMVLASLGYKSELHRGFNAFMSFTMVFTSVGVICSNALIFEYGLNTGGPVTLTWGWIVGSIFTILIAMSLAEITSTYPVSGSVYHWAGLLASKKYAGLSSFICGWFSFLGNAACEPHAAGAWAAIAAGVPARRL